MTQQKKYNSLDHAQHNHELCNRIYEMKDYPDWVVTVAFYSCLHYLRHKIFPFKNGDGIRVKNFDAYCKSKNHVGQKHSVFKKLVRDRCPKDVSVKYTKLLDLSYTARYQEYQIGNKKADSSIDCLRYIENFAGAKSA